jgi:3-hydroxyacyl-[acyl-carrier-protein] dehydratase
MNLPGSPVELGLPHREPFVFIDRVTALDPGTSAVAEKTFSPEDPLFLGHFPGDPIVPGVLLTEALAQTAGVAGASGGGQRRFLLSAIRNMKFPAAARPGQLITLSARTTGAMGGLWMFAVSAVTADGPVAEGQVVLSEVRGSM